MIATVLIVVVGVYLLAAGLVRSASPASAALALCMGVGYVIAAAFPCDSGSPVSGSARQTAHNLGGAVECIGGGFALMAIAESFGQPFKAAGFVVVVSARSCGITEPQRRGRVGIRDLLRPRRSAIKVKQVVDLLWTEPEERHRVHEILATYGRESHEREHHRVRLAVLKLSGGDIEKVCTLVSTAKEDYRDILMWAEYPEEGNATWTLKTLSPEEKERLKKLRVRDRKQYDDWLRRPKA